MGIYAYLSHCHTMGHSVRKGKIDMQQETVLEEFTF